MSYIVVIRRECAENGCDGGNVRKGIPGRFAIYVPCEQCGGLGYTEHEIALPNPIGVQVRNEIDMERGDA